MDGVRKYKQISEEQNENSSKILNQENKIKLKGQTGASKQMPLNISFTNCTGNITIDLENKTKYYRSNYIQCQLLFPRYLYPNVKEECCLERGSSIKRKASYCIVTRTVS